jgi:hypothetical protein
MWRVARRIFGRLSTPRYQHLGFVVGADAIHSDVIRRSARHRLLPLSGRHYEENKNEQQR